MGSLPDDFLCPVCALRLYLSRTASLPSRPRSLFVSPRSPAHSLSKNTLSFFIREVIGEAYSSAGRSLPSSSSSSVSSSSSSSRPWSSIRAYGVRGVAASWAFHCNAPLASILESATWSSPSVFSSFYLSDVHFSSSSGYGLGTLGFLQWRVGVLGEAPFFPSRLHFFVVFCGRSHLVAVMPLVISW